ncbi:MAG TPA: type 4 pilus major pilin [Alphaproteobacteria bacterium]|nr:type 4 pilus major pilin [Alphaproteobacteria bacterium]
MSISRKRRGFTLIELSIVLLIGGIIIAAIWVAAGSAWTSYRVYRANQQIAMSVMNIRDYYTNIQAFPATGDMTSAMDALSLFPVEMRRNTGVAAGSTPIDHALNNTITSGTAPANGAFHVSAVACPGSAAIRCFQVSLMGLSQAACVRLLTSAPIADNELGVMKIGAEAMTGSTTTMTTPVTAATASGWCTVAGNTNEFDIVYKLHN